MSPRKAREIKTQIVVSRPPAPLVKEFDKKLKQDQEKLRRVYAHNRSAYVEWAIRGFVEGRLKPWET